MAEEPAANPFAAGMANFRETTKWLVAGITATAAGVLAGSPLTGLGGLEWGGRLWFAMGCAGVAFLLLGIILWKALAVVAADTVTIKSLAEATGAKAAMRRRLEAELQLGMPFKCKTMAALVLEGDIRRDDTSPDGDARREAFAAAIAQFNMALGFYYKRDLFIQMRETAVQLMPVVILSIGGFAWATNPPEAAKPLTEKPRLVTLTLDKVGMAALSSTLTSACHPPAASGLTAIQAVVDAEFPDGRTDLITLPAAKDCAPVRLTQQNGRLFAAD